MAASSALEHDSRRVKSECNSTRSQQRKTHKAHTKHTHGTSRRERQQKQAQDGLTWHGVWSAMRRTSFRPWCVLLVPVVLCFVDPCTRPGVFCTNSTGGAFTGEECGGYEAANRCLHPDVHITAIVLNATTGLNGQATTHTQQSSTQHASKDAGTTCDTCSERQHNQV